MSAWGTRVAVVSGGEDDVVGTPPVRRFAPDALLGLVTAGAGLAELWARGHQGYEAVSPFFVLLVALTVGIARPSPGIALGLTWLTGLLQLTHSVPLLLSQAFTLFVAFSAARWGGRLVLGLSGASIVTGTVVAAGALFSGYYYPGILFRRQVEFAFNLFGTAATLVVLLLVLAAAWLAGLALRFQGSAVTSRRERVVAERESAQAHLETAQAYEIARLREEQTRLARDVHDVVGHSLAVILAQSESGQFLPDHDPAALKATLRTIAGTARASLRDVQQVLSASAQAPASGRLQGLVEGAQGTGFRIVSSTSGAERPLPPELAAVAYRVLQEMLTNALRHGDRDAPVTVVQRWPGESSGPGNQWLELHVSNGIPAAGNTPPATSAGGRGVEGMRRRLEGVGGGLEVVPGPAAGRFSVTARVPVRG